MPPVQGYAEIVEDPQVKHMKSLVTVPGAGDDRRAGDAGEPPCRSMTASPREVRLAPQPLGAQTAEVLQELGLAEAEIEALANDKVVTLRPAR